MPCRWDRISDLGLFLLTILALPAGAPAQKSLVGVYKLEPVITHPMIVDALGLPGRAMEGLKIGLHKSVPFTVKLERGKREGEYTIECDPEVNITRLILPGLINSKLEYEGRRVRPARFEISRGPQGLYVTSLGGSVGRFAGYEVTFVDLDHDGTLGTITDGYVVKVPKQKQWVNGVGEVDLRETTEALEIEGRKYWLEVDRPGFQLIVSDREPDFSVQRAEDAQAGLEYLNELRRLLNLDPVGIELALCGPCEQHALYCATNGDLTHNQDPSKPGYSKEGAVAGKLSELCYATTMREAVRSFEGTFYHRIDMLSPSLSHVGMGLVHGVAALDASSRQGKASFEPYSWPPDQALDVDPSWTSGESPSPIGEGDLEVEVARRYGFPVSLTFSTAAVAKVEARLFTQQGELETFVSSPEKPGNSEIPDNLRSILVMSKSPLPWDTPVRVEVRCEVAGKPFEKIWSFRTRAR